MTKNVFVANFPSKIFGLPWKRTGRKKSILARNFKQELKKIQGFVSMENFRQNAASQTFNLERWFYRKRQKMMNISQETRKEMPIFNTK